MEQRDEELEKIMEKKMKDWMERIRLARELAKYPEKPLELSTENFEETLRKFPYVVVDFWAEWCYPCLAMAPIINDLAKTLRGKVIFGKVNVDENREIAEKFGIMAIPTLIFFKNSQEVDRLVGLVPKQAILERVRKNFPIKL